jgi:hypothetical protein
VLVWVLTRVHNCACVHVHVCVARVSECECVLVEDERCCEGKRDRACKSVCVWCVCVWVWSTGRGRHPCLLRMLRRCVVRGVRDSNTGRERMPYRAPKALVGAGSWVGSEVNWCNAALLKTCDCVSRVLGAVGVSSSGQVVGSQSCMRV